MTQQNIEQPPKELELLKQLVGEWSVGIAVKTADGKVVSGCGEMTAVEITSGINSEINTHIEGYEDYYENDLWTFDQDTGKVHLFGMTSEGDAHDHVGGWKNDKTLELKWNGKYEGKDTAEDISLTCLTEDEIRVHEVDSSEGKISVTTDYVLKRKT